MGLNSIVSGVVGYWPLEEASGTRFDQSGSGNALSGVNTVGSALAVIGSGANFIRANSETLQALDSTVLDFGDEDFTIAFWAKINTKANPASQSFVGKFEHGTQRQYFSDYVGGGIDRYRFIVDSDGTGGTEAGVNADNFGSPATGVFNFIVCWHDSIANTINIQVNDGTPNSTAHSAGIFQGSAVFSLGSTVFGGSSDFFLDGVIDEVIVWNKVLTSDERSILYAGGDGVDLSEIIAGTELDDIGTDLRGYWPLNEASGIRFDQANSPSGINHFEEFNTVDSSVAVIGSGAHFTRANSEYLSVSGSENFDFGDEDFTIALWLSVDDLVFPAETIVGKWTNPNDKQYFIDWIAGGTNRFRFLVNSTGSNPDTVIVTANTFGALTANTFVFVIVWHDSVANTINIQVNNGGIDSVAHSAGINQGAGTLKIGAYIDGGATMFLHGIGDELAIWARTLTGTEKTALYNCGDGFDLGSFLASSTPPAGPAGPASGIDLETVSDGNPYIEVSGLPTFADEIRWPFGSGVNVDGNSGFSKDLDARLSDLQAQFGFNQQPHRFTMTWIPVCYDFDTNIIPPIGEEVDFNIGEFRVRGRIVHADLAKSTQGLKMAITVEDFRKDLSRIIVDTYGLYDDQEDPDVNVIDVHHWFLTTQEGQSNPRALRMLRENGATYRQIYTALLENNSVIASQIPTPDDLEQNIGDVSAYRFSFRTTPLLDALVKVFTDASFDLYWNIGQDRIQIVNRKEQINISLNEVPFREINPAAPTTISLKFGHDEPERPTAIQVLGDRMEGVISNGGDLSTSAGVYTSVGGSADLSLNSAGARFLPGWRNASIFYFGEDGTLLEDNPSDEELTASLKGIEFWTQKKASSSAQHLDSRIAEQGIDPVNGNQVAIVSPVSASGVGLIQNRGQDGRSWIIEWYNKVRNFAQNHYTRTYVLDSASTLFNQLDRFEVLQEAWCGLENQAPAFNQGYKIDPNFRWLAPFWDEEQNKVRAWATVPKTAAVGGSLAPLWGQDGKGVPTQFEQWNEDESRVFIPIEVRKWNRASSKFDSDFVLEAEKSPNGMLIRFPNTMWQTFANSASLAKLPKVKYLGRKFVVETSSDSTIDPVTEGQHYNEFTSGINIPVRVYERYGSTKPSEWTSGFGLDNVLVKRMKTEILQRDELAPWNFEPHDNKDSMTLLDSEGQAVADGRVVNRSESTFIEATKVGLPEVTFDEYSSPDGCVQHGISNLSLTKNSNSYWQTRYSAKTHFPQPVKARPVEPEVMEDFRFALHRINEKFNRPPAPNPIVPPEIFDPKTEDDINTFLTNPVKEAFKVPVIITQLLNITDSAGNPDVAYVGEDGQNVDWPAAARNNIKNSLSSTSKLGLNKNAFAIDGFLQEGMQATYNYEDQDDGTFVHYFTGGVQLRESRIVVAKGTPFQDINGDFRINVQIEADTLRVQIPNSNPIEFRTVTLLPIDLTNVLFSDQQNVDQTLRAGDKILMSGAGQENGNVVKPAFDGENYTIDMSEQPQKDKIFILTAGRAGAGVLFSTVLVKPNVTTGRGGEIQNISQLGGTRFSDGVIIGASEGVPGTQYFNDFVGLEFGQVAVGDPCIVAQEAEDNEDLPEGEPSVIRNLCFIVKPLFMATDAFGTPV